MNIKRLGLANLGLTDLGQVPIPVPLPPAQSLGWTDLSLDNNPLTNLDVLAYRPTIERLSLRNTQVDDLSSLLNLQDPSLIDLRDNTKLYCIQLIELENQFGTDVVRRPGSCLLNQVPDIKLLEPQSPLEVEEGTPVNLVATANDKEDGDITLQIQWTSSIDGFLGMGGNLTLPLTAGDHIITATVTDSFGATATSQATVTVTAKSVAYCSSKGTSTWFEWSNSVAFNGQKITTGNNGGYSDNTATEFIVQRGGSYPTILTPGFRYGAYTENWAAWIDFNHDGSFTTDERVLSGSSFTSLTRTTTIPVTAKTGKTRMRVVMRWGSSPSACGSYYYGETEDFTVNIQ
jgi:hypothetical protein